MKQYRRYLLFFFSLFLTTNLAAQVVLTDDMNSVSVGLHASAYVPLKQISVEEALLSADFIPVAQAVPNLGLQKHSVFLKFAVTNKAIRSRFLLDVAYPILDKIVLYEISKDNKVLSRKQFDETMPFARRKYDQPDFIFDINIPKDSTRNFLLEVSNTEQIILPITLNKPDRMWERLGKEGMLSGIYLGIILIMAVYNLFLFFSVRDRGYLYYVIYVVFTGLTQLGIKGFTFQFFWPGNPGFAANSTTVFASISCLATIYFTIYFLKLRLNAPKSMYLMWLLGVLFTLSILLNLLGYNQAAFQVMLSATTLETIVLLIVSIYVMRRGFEPARYFVAAWSVLLLGSAIFLMKDYGVLAYNFYTSYSVQAASALEMALLSFGLANSINILKKEKEQSQLLALQASKENERIVLEQNAILEHRVAERTRALELTNDDLANTLDNLKQAQSQLVEAEKMASLGQLTAGIAHEINNPINFVTSNVGPLKRDVAMVFETIDFVETLCFEDGLSRDEKKRRIEHFKEDMDYDYLKVEISHLLNGIHEGSSRTAEIVKGLRIFSRVDENDLKRADINEGIESSLIIVNNQLNGKIEVKRDFAKDLPMIECYPGKLNQVFLNIISNAIHAVKQQHGEKGTGLITIKTRTFADHITVEFMDNGTGMSEETQRKIYEPFFTTKEVGEGTGLGMSIVYNTIKKHNGTITLVSQVGQGTSFLINLPIVHEIKPQEN